MPAVPKNNDVTANLALDGAIEQGAIGLHRSILPHEQWASLSLDDQDLWRAEAEVVITAAAPLLARQVADAVTVGVLEAVGALMVAREPVRLTSIHQDGQEGSQRLTGQLEWAEAPAAEVPAEQVGS